MELMELGKGTPMLPVLISWARVVVRCDVVSFVFLLSQLAKVDFEELHVSQE